MTAFAIEAIRLVDHFHWRNKKIEDSGQLYLNDNRDKKWIWYKSYYNPADLHCLERTLLMSNKKEK